MFVSFSQRIGRLGASVSARCGQAAISFIVAIGLLHAIVGTDDGESYVVSLNNVDSDVVVVSLANVGFPAKSHAEVGLSDDATTHPARSEPSDIIKSASFSHGEPPPVGNTSTPDSAVLWAGQDMLQPMRLGLAGVSYNGADAVAHGRHKVGPEFFGAYRSLLKLVSVMGLQRIKVHVALRHVTVIGTASTYNPYRGGSNTNNIKTASGDAYDPTAWTAAIQIDLREHFGGIHYGRNYQPAYALVENGEKQIIVKVNDVGPLKPGRLIDLSERSMRYFDPLLHRGLVSDMKITLLPGADWTPGPVGDEQLINFASAQF
jgi:rare lipoprotein A